MGDIDDFNAVGCDLIENDVVGMCHDFAKAWRSLGFVCRGKDALQHVPDRALCVRKGLGRLSGDAS
jgi:hypothetical protein